MSFEQSVWTTIALIGMLLILSTLFSEDLNRGLIGFFLMGIGTLCADAVRDKKGNKR